MLVGHLRGPIVYFLHERRQVAGVHGCAPSLAHALDIHRLSWLRPLLALRTHCEKSSRLWGTLLCGPVMTSLRFCDGLIHRHCLVGNFGFFFNLLNILRAIDRSKIFLFIIPGRIWVKFGRHLKGIRN